MPIEQATSGISGFREDGQPPSADRPALEIADVRFGYPGGVHVLDGISMSIQPGSTVGIVGPSGCGKSTLLYIIGGLLSPSGGEVIKRTDTQRHPLSMVFQKDTVLPWKTVAENVRMFAMFRAHRQQRGSIRAVAERVGLAQSTAASAALDERVERLLRLVHLSDRADAYPYQLSGGMRRRLAFLTAVAPEPSILLLDEPFSSVDEPTRVGIHQDVFSVTRELNITTVLVTHDLAEAISLCDRIFILTQRPAVIARDQNVPFGSKRNMLELRTTKEFLEFYGELWDELSAQIGASPT